MHFLVSVAGIVIMSAAASLFSWYKSETSKNDKRAKAAESDADLAGGGS
ncbi:Uncharacterised protein [Mycobacterium tuberculosis]|nr:Uncharacterised protein [Mycobacterium tuberculosis]